jgi:L-serine dehydratase
VQVILYGSLGATGKGHGSDKAVLLGLAGHEPDTVDVDAIPALLAPSAPAAPEPAGRASVAFDEKRDLVFKRRESLPFHANGMRCLAFDAEGRELADRCLLLGGRRLRRQRRGGRRRQPAEGHRPRHHGAAHPFTSGDELLAHARANGLSIAELMRRNERTGAATPRSTPACCASGT